jgi:hypothetical protein
MRWNLDGEVLSLRDATSGGKIFVHTPSALHASLTHLNVDKPVNAIAFGWLDSEQRPL